MKLIDLKGVSVGVLLILFSFPKTTFTQVNSQSEWEPSGTSDTEIQNSFGASAVDPSRDWATFISGSDIDRSRDIALDSNGNVFVCGQTFSSDFPATENSWQENFAGDIDGYLAKFKPSGQLLWATFIGGSDEDQANDISIYNDQLYVHGLTHSSDFPVSENPEQDEIAGGGDAFLAKFNLAGEFQWATYFGGNGYESGNSGCSVDSDGDVIIHGYTASSDFPVTKGALQPEYAGGDHDSYLAKFSPSGGNIWATYFGGSNSEGGFGDSEVDQDGNIYIASTTDSQDFPVTEDAWQSELQGDGEEKDIFVAKFNSVGELTWATYFGGSSFETSILDGLEVDGEGNVYASGTTASSDFPVSEDAYQSELTTDEADGFLFKLNESGQRVWATYLGGAGQEIAAGCALDGNGNLFIQGLTESGDFPVIGIPFQAQLDFDKDGFIGRFNDSGQPLWLSYYGGSEDDFFTGGCEATADGVVYFQGISESADLPIPEDAWQMNHAGDEDPFIAKFSFDIVSVAEIDERKASLSVFPNPNKGNELNLKISGLSSEDHRFQIELYSLHGKRILTESFTDSRRPVERSITIDQNLDAGMYEVKIVSDGNVLSTSGLIVQ